MKSYAALILEEIENLNLEEDKNVMVKKKSSIITGLDKK